MRKTLDCYLHNHCLEDQPSLIRPPEPEERAELYSMWQEKTSA